MTKRIPPPPLYNRCDSCELKLLIIKSALFCSYFLSILIMKNCQKKSVNKCKRKPNYAILQHLSKIKVKLKFLRPHLLVGAFFPLKV